MILITLHLALVLGLELGIGLHLSLQWFALSECLLFNLCVCVV